MLGIIILRIQEHFSVAVGIGHKTSDYNPAVMRNPEKKRAKVGEKHSKNTHEKEPPSKKDGRGSGYLFFELFSVVFRPSPCV